MENKRTYIKRTVTVIAVSKPQHSISFQVRHPENAKAIIGIRVTTTLTRALKVPPASKWVGMISIARPDKGDVIFSDEIKPDDNQTMDITTRVLQASFDYSQYQRNGTQQTFFETYFPITDAVWDGYYEDHFIPTGFKPKSPLLYQVRLYLIYKLNPEP